MAPTNSVLLETVQSLRKDSSSQRTNLWDRIADDLEKPARGKRVVNVSRLNRYTNANETVIVPGKVLGSGALDHAITIAAFAFSESAKKQIENAKGKCISIQELVKLNPKGKNVRIIG